MVNDEIKFNSLNELYQRLIPALRVRVTELKREKLPHIKEEDIWNYLVDKVWVNKKSLEMCELVNDILKTDTIKLIEYTRLHTTDYKKLIDWNE